MNSGSTFREIFFKTKCSNNSCAKKLIITLSDPMLKYGFYCPFCKTITAANEMFQSILENDKRFTGNGEN